MSKPNSKVADIKIGNQHFVVADIEVGNQPTIKRMCAGCGRTIAWFPTRETLEQFGTEGYLRHPVEPGRCGFFNGRFLCNWCSGAEHEYGGDTNQEA